MIPQLHHLTFNRFPRDTWLRHIAACEGTEGLFPTPEVGASDICLRWVDRAVLQGVVHPPGKKVDDVIGREVEPRAPEAATAIDIAGIEGREVFDGEIG